MSKASRYQRIVVVLLLTFLLAPSFLQAASKADSVSSSPPLAQKADSVSPKLSAKEDDPLVIQLPTIDLPTIKLPTINLRPVVQVLTAPFRFVLFVKEALDHASKELAGFLSGPPEIATTQKPLARVISQSAPADIPQASPPQTIVTRLVNKTTLVHDVVIEHSPSLLPPPR